ncbi:hypothetical protein HD554DRAFT_2166606 [Boletus coccyginus]|nr:hypothetical protein HD554DRAFT_2166606 [Boletus coccyginus]
MLSLSLSLRSHHHHRYHPPPSPSTTTTTTTTMTTTADAAVTTMTLERRVTDGREWAIMREMVEVPYDTNDLEGRRREELVVMVQRQPEKWPYRDGRHRFTSKTNMDRMRGILLNRTLGFMKEVEVIRPLSPSPVPHAPGQPVPQQDTEMCGLEDHWDDGRCPLPSPLVIAQLMVLLFRTAHLSGDEEEEPTGSLGGGRASPGVRPEDEDDQHGNWDAPSAGVESVKADVYVTFVSPGIEDQRNMYSVEVPRVRQVDAALPHEWQTDTERLIEQLAMRAPQLADAKEVSYPDPLYPEYSRHLKAATAGSNIVEAHADVPTVCVPASNTLKLTASFRPMPSSSAGLGAGPVHQPAGQPQSMVGMVSEPAPVPSKVIQWLMEVAKTWEGYTAFKQGQHHMQTNAAIVASWWFAVLFSEHYSQTVAPVQVHDHKRKRSKLIRKSEVQRALDVGATWMSEAAQAVALLRKYGKRGSSPRQHVVDMCSDQTTKIGARTLLFKLRGEDKEQFL